MFTSIGDYRSIDNMCDTLLAQGMDTALILNELQKRFYSVSTDTLAARLNSALYRLMNATCGHNVLLTADCSECDAENSPL